MSSPVFVIKSMVFLRTRLCPRVSHSGWLIRLSHYILVFVCCWKVTEGHAQVLAIKMIFVIIYFYQVRVNDHMLLTLSMPGILGKHIVICQLYKHYLAISNDKISATCLVLIRLSSMLFLILGDNLAEFLRRLTWVQKVPGSSPGSDIWCSCHDNLLRGRAVAMVTELALI